MKKYPPILFILTLCTYADLLEDSGINELLDYNGLTELPLTAGENTLIGMVEAPEPNGQYMPNQADSRFSNVIFNNITNSSSAVSGHANTVARFLLSDAESFTPGIPSADVYEATSFFNSSLSPTFGNLSQLNADIFTTAFIANQALNNQIRALDQIADEQGVLFITALNNGSRTATPEVFASAYNSLTVGLSSRRHSNGDTRTTVDGGGRTKPDIVSNINSTSWSSGHVGSVAAYLFDQASNTNQSDYLNNVVVQRAALLAGATKAEFPDWNNNSTVSTQPRSLDPNYGAGEVNAFHSSRIVEAGQNNNSHYGWDLTNVTNQSSTYTFVIPPEATSATLNFVATWNRQINISVINNTSVAPIADLKLELTGGDLDNPIVCDSALDNTELIHAPNLSPGTYTVTVSRNTNTSASAGIAWRLNFETEEMDAAITNNADNTNTIATNEALPGVRYDVYRSTDLVNWEVVNIIVPTNNQISWTDPTPTTERFFYRFKYWP